MSILIKGMEMPTNCDDCLLGSDCPHDQSIDGYKMQGGRPRNCPLVPVPAHGDLIERDALMQHEVLLPQDGGHLPIVYSSYVRNAPTIIPAEEGER